MYFAFVKASAACLEKKSSDSEAALYKRKKKVKYIYMKKKKICFLYV